MVIQHEMDARYGPRTSAYGLCPCKPQSYGHLHAIEQAMEHPMSNTVLTQYSVNKGLKMFDEAGAEVMIKELKQLHDRGVMSPKLASDLLHDVKWNALQYLMFLKQKQCGKIKGRGCANGHKQQGWLGKEDTTSPTVMMESVMLSCMIDAKEQCNIAMADIPGAFMQTDLMETVHI